MHNLLRCAVYTMIIVYFEKLIKHLNIEEIINMIKMTLFNNCFNKWCKKIEIMLLIVKTMNLLKW